MRKVGCDCSVRGRRECAGLKIQCTPAHDACNACVCRYDAVPGMQLPCRRSESRNLRHDMKARICINDRTRQRHARVACEHGRDSSNFLNRHEVLCRCMRADII